MSLPTALEEGQHEDAPATLRLAQDARRAGERDVVAVRRDEQRVVLLEAVRAQAVPPHGASAQAHDARDGRKAPGVVAGLVADLEAGGAAALALDLALDRDPSTVDRHRRRRRRPMPRRPGSGRCATGP